MFMKQLLGRFHHGMIVASSLVLATGALVVAFAGPAAASNTPTDMDLANIPVYGTYASNGVVAGSIIKIDTQPGSWVAETSGSWTAGDPSVTGTNTQYHAQTSNGTVTDLCLANTTGGASDLATCGANGTYWVVVQSGNGYYLYNRYYLDAGENYVLGVQDPTGGSEVTLVYQPNLTSGDGAYARWSVAP
jgi:hypothetical protein